MVPKLYKKTVFIIQESCLCGIRISAILMVTIIIMAILLRKEKWEEERLIKYILLKASLKTFLLLNTALYLSWLNKKIMLFINFKTIVWMQLISWLKKM